MLTSQEISIGRAVDCAIRTEDALVSRHHARVFMRNHQYHIEDLRSANGVWVDDVRVASHVFRNGDAVRCGSLWLRFVQEQAPRAVAPSAASSHYGQAPPPAAAPMQAGPPPAAPPAAAPARTPPAPAPDAQPQPSSLDGVRSDESFEEVKRLRRRNDQLQAELRILRSQGGKADLAARLEDAEQEIASITEERNQLRAQVDEYDSKFQSEGLDARMARARQVVGDAGEIVTELNDVLSNLRINIMAAEGEFEQFAGKVPNASYELILEALRSSRKDINKARQLLRKIRNLD